MKDCIGEEDYGRQLKWIMAESLFLVKKNPFTALKQVRNITIKRNLHKCQSRGCEMQTTCNIKEQKASLDFSREHLKKPPKFWNWILWTDEELMSE